MRMHEHSCMSIHGVPEVPGHVARLLLVLPQLFKQLWDGEHRTFPQPRCHHSSLCCTLQASGLSLLLPHGGLLAPSSVGHFLEQYLYTLSYQNTDTNVMQDRVEHTRSALDACFAEACFAAGARSAAELPAELPADLPARCRIAASSCSNFDVIMSMIAFAVLFFVLAVNADREGSCHEPTHKTIHR